MNLGLSGKAAIITGASAGIGFACSKALFEEGASIVMVARNPERMQQATAAILQGYPEEEASRIVTVNGDMRDSETVKQTVSATMAHFGRIDILINNAGSARAGSFFEMPEEAFLEAWNLKLLGYIRMVKEAAPHMIRQGDGRIVNIVGGAGRTPGPTFLAGSTANAALLNFTRGISKELARSNVRINAISPGTTATERALKLAEQNANAKGITVEAQQAELNAAIPLGHIVDPAEIAAMALLLVSDRVPSITGTEIVIDGGQQPGV
ncbi:MULTISPECIES: SDR family oxidoreductase [unclassified Paenibacillus]|uniref:SDR family oxidoreductase n=1 Tax=unclassified Paenibacillus TaxID=185978 RepID=UPI001AE413FF|nr:MULTISPECIES: SDR family oxidoreductase [unclassified Paenibacillus]MBP1156672.1 3-oxoacyl-[acyl-carrier protein] reductase/bacilysin biosynthesis oxidoreductase BacG [Paenibacillus sp. PvP091]MBP1172590.1 3-oxoacyl-[acyl-carrier protein] reductase/bacilysin biosynthesis oxidoreductase BacG [Paenibacillus sp. PvR098]MBP2438970.1 3-oxoacyl-[acyl-carrier protein] reductase/bacilysin biosynthesis oxidoreductase BacG [Paenibacillus sp. PvP052]